MPKLGQKQDLINMGDCNLTYTCPKNCKYTYASWCPVCEKNSPRRRSRSETNEPRLDCRKRCKEMKTFTPKKYTNQCTEYENMDLEYHDFKESWCESSRNECCRVRTNLCELPTTYISNNCQNTAAKLDDYVVVKPKIMNSNQIAKETKISPLKSYYQPQNTQNSLYDNQYNGDYTNCREFCNLVDFPVHENNLCFNTGTYFDTREKESSSLHEKYNKEVEYLRNRLIKLKNTNIDHVDNIANKFMNNINGYEVHMPETVKIVKPLDLKHRRRERRIISPPLIKGIRSKASLKTRLNSGRINNNGVKVKKKVKPVVLHESSEETLSLKRFEENCINSVEKLKIILQSRNEARKKDSKSKMYQNTKMFDRYDKLLVEECKEHNIDNKIKTLKIENVKKKKFGYKNGSSLCGDFEENDCSGTDESDPELGDEECNSEENSTADSKKDSSDESTSISCIETGSGDFFNWPVRHSLFPHIPPYISFKPHDLETVVKVPQGGKLLKWKLSTITPILVRQTLTNSGFSLVRSEFSRESNQWLGTWGKHMKSPMFKTLKETQKINHFPGTFQLGRKDRLWRNFQRLINKYGHKEFGFLPHTYVLPQELKLLKQNWEFKNGSGGEMWIIKPPASARGVGIKVINKWSQLPKKMSLVVQKYIHNPYLINGSKFDLRLYVLVTSFHPLRIYLWPDGLARFASAKYSDSSKDLKDRYKHLTNYSINKLSDQYTANEDANACQGHKWTISKLLEYLQEEKGVNTKQLWKNLQQLVIKTMLTAESPITTLCEENINSIYNCYELFGVDVLLDENLKPWLLEVNISPSLHSASPLDAHVKGPLVHTLFDMAQFHFPPKLAQTVRQAPQCFEPKLYSPNLTKRERTKHILYQQYEDRPDYLFEILRDLTGDDVRQLCRAEDEFTAKGRFERIFPSKESFKYLQFMEKRYYNRLFDAWEAKYGSRRQDGIELLKTLCSQKLHLKVASQSSIKKSSPSTNLLEPSKEGQSRPLEEILKEATITHRGDVISA